MSDQRTLQGIADDVKDIFATSIDWGAVPSNLVPHDDDAGFTFETGKTKRGKTMQTAVLFVDLRKSTSLNFEHHPDKVAKLYAAFVKSMIVCAETHGGVVRNIIGDRIMVVFPEDGCCNNAVRTAISMNSVVTKILDAKFRGDEIRAGIGIDFGKMFVAKAGMPAPGKERSAYKNLVWLGRPANIASKLTDLANKVTAGIAIPNILMTESVFNRYKMANSSAHDILNNYWKEQTTVKLEMLTEKIWGSSTYWLSANQVQI